MPPQLLLGCQFSSPKPLLQTSASCMYVCSFSFPVITLKQECLHILVSCLHHSTHPGSHPAAFCCSQFSLAPSRQGRDVLFFFLSTAISNVLNHPKTYHALHAIPTQTGPPLTHFLQSLSSFSFSDRVERREEMREERRGRNEMGCIMANGMLWMNGLFSTHMWRLCREEED